MSKMKVTILGCGSALPTEKHFNSSQVLNIGEKLFMIDCGEGAQIRLRQLKIKTSKLNHIFISHLHGDHCFGLIGFISTLGMLGRKENLYIYAHADLEKILQPQIDYFCQEMPYRVIFNHINPRANEVIFEDRTIRVTTIPLKHAIPTCGFLFEEKEKERHLIREKINFFKVPVRQLHLLKKGADFVCPDGKIIPNSQLTKAGEPAKKYAYCSDTAYFEKVIPIIQGADCLFHEATFTEKETIRAKETFHSTAKQAAEIALKAQVKKLLIGHYSARYRNYETILAEAKSVFEDTFATEDGNIFEI
ncbi:MAG: ribonuclease Z [Paludibacteraceae bacterium]|nr:ribonuclease Z [Paludibacteraceae bacterium]